MRHLSFSQQANGSNVNVFYSTPSCYLYALNQAGQSWTTKSDDFFPYAHHPHGFWTGYFTSRAAFKGYERHSNNILQSTRQLNAFANVNAHEKIFTLSQFSLSLSVLAGEDGSSRRSDGFGPAS